MTGWALVCGFAALSLAACSGAEGVDATQPEGDMPVAEPSSAEAKHDGHGPMAMDGAGLIERFDKDGNGTVELAELPEHKQKWLGKADADKDGKLTAAELKAAGEAKRRHKFERADENGDGALTATEIGEERWSKLSVADVDKDSRITMAELDKARADGKLSHGLGKGMKGHHGPIEPAKLIAKLDKDGNGTLEAAELPERMGKMLEHADANKDGKLTADELKQHAATRGEHHRKGKERKGGAPESI
jgi:Ca2+-binding EF-hand superfamily protein